MDRRNDEQRTSYDHNNSRWPYGSGELKIGICVLKIVFILANSADPDEIPPHAAFHLGLHCMQKDLFTSMEMAKEWLYMWHVQKYVLHGSSVT